MHIWNLFGTFIGLIRIRKADGSMEARYLTAPTRAHLFEQLVTLA